ncbi:AIR synthase related protein [Streptomyces sp. NBC_01476]|uniref:MSMEG_0567/sll0787 family protein n=1 Tax=Streptomyces sp. NBC_01476 TaxID=2903881 RepID=UPI002E302461|nr:MSMEG_0567/sll0787 family protein [Streptomyces sp. NBC_01476]
MLLDGGSAAPDLDSGDDILALLGDRSTLRRRPAFTIGQAAGAAETAAYRRLRRDAFVHSQGLFDGHDLDHLDDDPRTVVLVARDPAGTVLGGVRLAPYGGGPDIGWWTGSRLVAAPGAPRGVGAALVRAACARAEAEGVLRFEATVQLRNDVLFRRLGWLPVRPVTVAGAPHILMRRPIGRIADQSAATKAALGPLLTALHAAAGAAPAPGTAGEPAAEPAASFLGGPGFVGDDGAPVPGSDLIAACDAILPSMVERDPQWAGWCAVLVNVNDLAAMGASPVGLLDALGAPDAAHAGKVLAGLGRAAAAYGVAVLGGHTQLGVPAALSVTALGRTDRPVPGGGGRAGHAVRLTADLGGGWRPGYRGRQWDSTSHRRPAELRAMLGAVGRAAPAAAKDVSMAGIAGTLGMLAEASGCGAVLDVAAVPRPDGATAGDWLTCFPGFAMLTADEPGAAPLPAGPATGAVCGELTAGQGVGLRWPDGEITEAVTAAVTGMGTA